MTKFWIGVASYDHVASGVQGGFCQLGHGKMSAVRRISPGDWIIYYSPRAQMKGGEPVQAFTAIGRVREGEPYSFDMGDGFVAGRRNVAFLACHKASIRPLIEVLDFIKDKGNWAYSFRFGTVGISEKDFRRIAGAMGVEPDMARAG